MSLAKCASIGDAVQYLLKEDAPPMWDMALEDMYSSLYVPETVSLDRVFKDNSLGQLYQKYRKQYGLEEKFFPFPTTIKKGISRIDYFACLIHHYHHYVRVLAAYELSDEDNRRLESFLMGHNPLPFAIFFQRCFKNSEIKTEKYKGLKDLWAAPVSWEDHKRGERTEGIFSYKIEEIIDVSIEDLRKKMKIEV